MFRRPILLHSQLCHARSKLHDWHWSKTGIKYSIWRVVQTIIPWVGSGLHIITNHKIMPQGAQEVLRISKFILSLVPPEFVSALVICFPFLFSFAHREFIVLPANTWFPFDLVAAFVVVVAATTNTSANVRALRAALISTTVSQLLLLQRHHRSIWLPPFCCVFVVVTLQCFLRSSVVSKFAGMWTLGDLLVF